MLITLHYTSVAILTTGIPQLVVHVDNNATCFYHIPSICLVPSLCHENSLDLRLAKTLTETLVSQCHKIWYYIYDVCIKTLCVQVVHQNDITLSLHDTQDAFLQGYS